jgi:dTDP-4-amino-4,6-dideoxy-D-galactose acyltransferase
MASGEPCRYLEWDTEFFGARIARFEAAPLTPAAVAAGVAWCKAQTIECVYLEVDVADREAVRLAERHGFSLVDVRVVLEREVASTPAPDKRIRESREEDVPALRAIAKVSHQDSRYYHDEHFARERCDALYETWIEKSCRGYADRVLVADSETGPKGYLTLHLEPPSGARIGLVGIDRTSQGQGLGGALMAEALRWLAERGIKRLRVVTQGRNAKAQRFYQDWGFRTVSVGLFYHGWFSDTPQAPSRP